MVDGRWSMGEVTSEVNSCIGAMMSIQGYRDLIVWQRAMDLVETVYRVTRAWPKDELYGLTNQMRRAVVSIPANIAEGQGRTGAKELAHHLSIANGSLCEVETFVLISHRLGYSDERACQQLMAQTTEVAKLVGGLLRSLH